MPLADAPAEELFDAEPGLLAGDGVTLDQVRSFAEAAAAFARARPWRYLTEMDRIQVEALDWRSSRFVYVLGWAEPERGLLFSPESGAEAWRIHFTASGLIPARDLDLWERHGLAVASAEDYPRVSGPEDRGRPGSRLLGLFDAVLRALAFTSEDEMDSGQWEKTVETALGPLRLALRLPDLLHPPDPEWPDEDEEDWDDDLDELEEFADEDWLDGFALEGEPALEEDDSEGPPTPEMQAQRLVYEAWESLGRRRAALARRALAHWPGCADAWTLLAERERDPERAVFLYSRAVEEAGRAIYSRLPGLDAGENTGSWAGHEAQPYLSARFGLAEALWQADRCEEAVAHFREVLRLDPGDRQGARGRLVDSLLLLGHDGEAAQVLDAYPGDPWARPLYSRALLAFRREGDSVGARNCLTLALARNRFVPEYLLFDEHRSEPPPLIRVGDRSEALLYAMDSLEVWESTPGALDWLRERSKVGKRKSR